MLRFLLSAGLLAVGVLASVFPPVHSTGVSTKPKRRLQKRRTLGKTRRQAQAITRRNNQRLLYRQFGRRAP